MRITGSGSRRELRQWATLLYFSPSNTKRANILVLVANGLLCPRTHWALSRRNGSNQMHTLRIHPFLCPNPIVVIALSILLLFPALSPGQNPPQAGSPGSQAPAAPGPSANPSLSTTVNEVSFDLAVRGKHNKPVLDLVPSQLAVTDGGSPVHFSSLRLVDGASGSEHLVTLVFDRLDPGAVKAVRRIIENILAVIPEKGYSFAVLQVNGRLRLLQAPTQDRGLLEAAIAKATPNSFVPLPADLTPAEKALIASAHSDVDTLDSADRNEEKLILSALEQSQRILADHRRYPSLAALLALVQSQRLQPGRKFIFYFSAGVDSSADARDILHSIVGQANRAGVTICAIDTSRVNGRISSAQQGTLASTTLGKGTASGNVSAFGTGNLGTSVGNGSPGFSPGGGTNNVAARNIAGYAFGDLSGDQSPLDALAFGTGGVYIGTSGGYKHQLQRLHDDLTNWYEASWTPPIKNYDGQFRPVVIHSLRKGIYLRARSGYFAVPPTEASELRPIELPLLNILAGATLPSDMAFRAGVLHLGAQPDGNFGEVIVQVPVAQLALHEDSTTHISSVDAAIIAVIKDGKGNVIERFGQDFPLHETPDQFRHDPGQVITFEEHFSGAPGVYSLETAVMDRLANKAGAQRTTFTIEGPPQGPALSDIALVKRVDPAPEDDLAYDPMLCRDGRVVPNLASQLPEDTRSLSLFFLIHPVAGSQSQPALRMQIFRNGRMLTEMPMDLDKISGSGAAVPYLATIHGHVFAPGEYQVKTFLTQDGSTVSNSAAFSVAGVATASNAPDPSLTAVGSSNPESDSGLVSEASTSNSLFVVTNATTPVPPPSDAEIQTTIEEVRQRALAWSNSLENFMCYEVTRHSVDATGHGDWTLKDTIIELLKYVDHEESRTTFMLNGDRSDVQLDHLEFMHSAGEFGSLFHVIFNPSAQTAFTWKQYAFIDGQPVQVYAFKVALSNSNLFLSDRNFDTLHVGFHGLLYLDPATRSVRRISIDADDIPSQLHISATSISVDYSWVTMQDHDFLLPVRGAVGLQEAKSRPVLNDFEFHGYHRFGSQSHVLSDEELKALPKN